MRAIPMRKRNKMNADPFYKVCIRSILGECDCEGRIEFEHCFIYAGKQLNEIWAIIPCCTYHHRGAGLNKELNKLVALMRATPNDFVKYPKKNWQTELDYLANKYPKEFVILSCYLKDL